MIVHNQDTVARIWALASVVFVVSSGCGLHDTVLVSGACQSDAACKHGRICVSGVCRFPSEADGGPVLFDGGSGGGADGGLDGGVVPLDGGTDGGVDGGLDGGAGTGRIGDPCEATSACGEGDTPICYTEADTFGTFPGGYCSARCGDTQPCPEGSTCGFIFGTDGACLRACASDAECREGYGCSDLLGPRACIPAQLLP